MSKFKVRLLDEDDTFVYYDHTEEKAGSKPHEVTVKWSSHDVADLNRIITMLEGQGHRFEVQGLVRLDDPFDPAGGRWAVDPKIETATSPRAIHDEAMAKLESGE